MSSLHSAQADRTLCTRPGEAPLSCSGICGVGVSSHTGRPGRGLTLGSPASCSVLLTGDWTLGRQETGTEIPAGG